MRLLFLCIMVLLAMAGSVVAQEIELVDGENWVWDLELGGYAEDGGLDPDFDFDTEWRDTFDDHHFFEVNGSDYDASLGTTENNGREAVFETQTFEDIDAWRKVYVPSDYGFARFLQCVTNTGASTANVTIKIYGDLGTSGQPLGSDGDFSNDNDADSEDRWILWGSDNSDGESMVLFDGVNGNISGTAFYEVGDDCTDFKWDFSLEPGETKYFVYFAAQRVGFTDLREIIGFLIDHPEIAFAGMSTAELEGVCNWAAGDADADGLVDSWEALHGVNSPTADDDNDGLTNQEEYDLGTNPVVSDTDNDGLDDGEEDDLGYDPLDRDSDDDGLSDGAEDDLGTNPLVADTDGDLVPDGMEHGFDQDPLTFTDYGPNGLGYWDVFCGIGGIDATGDGTQANPYFSVERATEDHPDFVPEKSLNIGSADTFDIFVGPGYYEMTFNNEWNDLGDMKIEGAGRGICTLDGEEDDDYEYEAFYFWGDCPNIEISGFSLFGVDYGVDASDNFGGLYVHDMDMILFEYGIYMSPDTDSNEYTISNCEFRLCDNDAIYFSNSFSEELKGGLELEAPETSGEILNISNVSFFGNAGDTMIELYGVDDVRNGTVNIDNAVIEHSNYSFYIFCWGTVNIRDSSTENCDSASYFGELNHLCIENSIFSGNYDDENVKVNGSIDLSLTLRNNVFIQAEDSCFFMDAGTPDSANVEIRNNVFALTRGDAGLEWNGSNLLGTGEDYNAFFGNNTDVVDEILTKVLLAHVNTNSISDTDGDFVEDDIMADLLGYGIYTPQTGSVFLAAGDDKDGDEDTLDNNIGADNSNSAVASANVEPGTGNLNVSNSDPDSDSFGAGVTLDLSDLATGGTVTITKVDDDEVTDTFAGCALKRNEGRVFDISTTATFQAGAVISIQLPYQADGEGKTSKPRVYHLVVDDVTGDCEWVQLDNITFDPATGLVTANHNTDDGFSPFAVAGGGGSLPFIKGAGGGAMDWSMMLGLLALVSMLIVRRRM